MAIRSALGAGRTRLQRQLLTESILLSVSGAALGLLLAYLLTSILATRAGVIVARGDINTSAPIRLDSWVFLFTAGVALVTGVLIGIVPAWQTARADVSGGLKESGRSATANRGQRRYRNVLVSVEVALSMLLLLAAGLLVRSFAELRRVQPGVRVDQLLTAGLSLPESRYDQPAKIATFARQLVNRLEALPGVQRAGLVSCLPVGGYCGDRSFQIDGQPLPPGHYIFALNRAASPGYFSAAGIPILFGRPLNEDDAIGDDKHPRDGAMVISQATHGSSFQPRSPRSANASSLATTTGWDIGSWELPVTF